MNVNNKIKISFVSPVYLAKNTIKELVFEIQKVMKIINEPYEIILVDDRSPDNSWEIMKTISKNNSEVKIIRLSKNFGQHPAIMAGLEKSIGEWVVVLDCDLQDQPKEVLKLYNKTKEGYNVVLAKRILRKDSFLKKMSSLFFSKVYSFFTDTHYDNEIANFGIYNRKVIDSILKITDYIKFFPLFVKLVGFSTIVIEVEHAERKNGKSSYNLSSLLSLAFNVIISFSNKPLKLFVKLGIFISFVSFLFALYNFYLFLTNKISVLGYSSLIISIWMLSGMIITIIGITGIYVGKTFDQAKNRPIYFIDEIK